MASFINSSIGRKVIMSVSGAALLLFITFHLAMNCILLFSDDAYRAVCAFLGANWYALVGTAVLAALVAVHFAYGLYLTILNRKARGEVRYATRELSKEVSVESLHMMELGFIVLVGLIIHLFNFWSKMQLVEIANLQMATINGVAVDPIDGATIVRHAMSKWYIIVVYLVWFWALWRHLKHGIWSMFQTVGATNAVWIPRLKKIAICLSTLIMGSYACLVVILFIQETIK